MLFSTLFALVGILSLTVHQRRLRAVRLQAAMSPAERTAYRSLQRRERARRERVLRSGWIEMVERRAGHSEPTIWLHPFGHNCLR